MLENLHTSACLNLNYDTTKQKSKMFAKIVEFIKTCNQYPYKSNFCYFFSSRILPPLGEKQIFRKPCSEEMGNFFLPGGMFCIAA